MTMTKIPLRKVWYASGHGPLIFLFHPVLMMWNLERDAPSGFHGIEHSKLGVRFRRAEGLPNALRPVQ